jgi:hypothetical protein
LSINDLKPKNILFYGAIFISLVIIGYYLVNPKTNENSSSVQPSNTSVQESSKAENSTQQDTGNKNLQPETNKVVASGTTVQDQEKENTDPKANSNTPNESTQDKQTSDTEISTSKTAKSGRQVKQSEINKTKQTENNSAKQEEPTPTPKAEPTAAPIEAAIKIVKNDITSEAKFFPYEFDNTKMEVIAVKASDGTIRTALNTCQICFDSGKGYYEQVGEYLVCQNCGNRFHIDQIEKIKGGCNPVPILETDKTDNEDSILISKDFLESKKDLFTNWQKYN